ncbi:hypothetical protein TNCV_52641 [Trichonephila clavipes]|nr:hypothetical protein TNCV_52641 [Trichonephila clavipes]
MYKNALKEDLIRVVEDLDGTVESTDTIAKLKTKIEKSSTFESDADFVKTLIKNCIDEWASRNERKATLEKQKIETATHIGIREAEDWFRPIDLAKECDIYISSRSGSHDIPVCQRARRLSCSEKLQVDDQIDDWLQQENTQFNDFTKHSDDAVSTLDRSKDEDQTRSRNSKTIGRGNRGDIHRKS